MHRFHTGALIAALALLAGCGLSPSTREQIADEHRRLVEAQQQLNRSRHRVEGDLAANADLFANRPEAAHWSTQLSESERELARAAQLDRELEEIAHQNRRQEQRHAAELVRRANQLQQAAVKQAHEAENGAARWVGFKTDPQTHLAELKTDYDRVHDLTIGKRIDQAEHDWPAKKDALAGRYATVLDLSNDADSIWRRTAEARGDLEHGKITGEDIARLVEAEDELSRDENALRAKSTELERLVDQLYTSWDKILVDLDNHDGEYRERIRTVRTHITDFAARQSETSSSEQWMPVSKPQFESVQDDLGMALAHKDAGLFDSEANTTPEPAGFAYIAPESVGRNQYGYWTHDHGQSVWTWLPQYLILRELLWNHDYRPVVLEEYRGYRGAQSAGKTYYGTNPATSTPKFGTHGSFTRTTYASSRYVQSGSFAKSAYASYRVNSSPSQSPRSSAHFSSGSAGKRFGGNTGRSFGRRADKSFGRGFGRHR